jgi:hypothetical protein
MFNLLSKADRLMLNALKASSMMFLLACQQGTPERRAYCEMAERRFTQCGIRFPVPNNCLRGTRTAGDFDEMSCREIEEACDRLGYLW